MMSYISKIKIIIVLQSLFILQAFTQSNRITDKNNIGWYAFFVNKSVNNKWSLHAEYQWRRDDYITSWQQSLSRVGLSYNIAKGISVRAGYAFVQTFNYGDYPLQAAGKTFPEHRTFQALFLNNNNGIVEFSHRIMLEQRWVGRFINTASTKPDETVYTNRLRYMFRTQIPFTKNKISTKNYVALYDEIHIGFGKNVGANVFDQNRLGILLGHKFSKSVRIETGYFSQILQLGRLINGSNVYQYNNGFIINNYFNL